MKKIFCFTVLCISVFLQGCSMDDDFLSQLERANFPEHIKKNGEVFANDLNKIVRNLNKMNVDYSKADKSTVFKERFYEDFYRATDPMLKSGVMTTQMSPEMFAEKARNLTEIQIEYINRIIKECEKSTSYRELMERLININKDIYSDVPKIQQDRLFNVTATLYYGISELQNLEKQGQMLRMPHNSMLPVRLKSGNESGGGGGSCSKFLATVWVIAVGEPTPVGEIVASVVTILVGGVWLYEVITCTTSNNNNNNNDDCDQLFQNCSSTIPDGCGICLQFCKVQGYWPPYSTHKCNSYR